MFIRCQTSVVARAEHVAGQVPATGGDLGTWQRAKQTPEGFDSSSTNIASDHGVGNERRSIAITCGRSAISEGADR